MKRKAIASIMALTLTAAALAGCGSESSEKSEGGGNLLKKMKHQSRVKRPPQM